MYACPESVPLQGADACCEGAFWVTHAGLSSMNDCDKEAKATM